mmetsp:Transcript_930/g.1933  ORF Transcript_930/g.1933 Transcript_930/m.1933 type:complete len:237 (-) Transcript_930:1588-2298(-)
MLGQNLSAVIVVFSTILHKRPAINITNIRNKGVALLNSKNVKATDLLLENQNNSPRNLLLPQCQNNRKSHLLPILIPLHLSIHRRTLPRLGMPIIRTNRIHLHIRTLRLNKLLVNVTPIPSNVINFGIEFGRSIAHLAKELFAPSPGRAGVVYCNVVIVRIHGLFHEGLVDHHSIHLNVIIVLVNLRLIIGNTPAVIRGVIIPTTTLLGSISGALGNIAISAHEYMSWDIDTTLLQ